MFGGLSGELSWYNFLLIYDKLLGEMVGAIDEREECSYAICATEQDRLPLESY